MTEQGGQEGESSRPSSPGPPCYAPCPHLPKEGVRPIPPVKPPSPSFLRIMNPLGAGAAGRGRLFTTASWIAGFCFNGSFFVLNREVCQTKLLEIIANTPVLPRPAFELGSRAHQSCQPHLPLGAQLPPLRCPSASCGLGALGQDGV